PRRARLRHGRRRRAATGLYGRTVVLAIESRGTGRRRRDRECGGRGPPPDPATVGPEKSTHPFHPLPPDAPAQQRLARVRAGLRSTRSNLEDIRATAGRVRALSGLPDAEDVGGHSLALVGAVERATGLDPEVARGGLVVIRKALELK